MLDGRMPKGEWSCGSETDMHARTLAIRDWPAFRIATASHPLVGTKYRVWPLLDFESAVEDHLLGTTHIIRGKDLADSGSRQRYLYTHLGWVYPQVIHWGRIKIHQFGSFSPVNCERPLRQGSTAAGIDPRVPTVRAARCRGIRPEALRKFMIDLGVGETDISISMDSIYAENRRLIDPEANRRFFVWEPVELTIEGEVPALAKAPLHPTADRGFREIPAGNKLFICKSDLEGLHAGDNIRLKDLCNVEILSLEPAKARFLGKDMGKRTKIIQWAPANGPKVRVHKPDGVDEGIGEAGIAEEIGKVVQFERYGFARINSVGEPIVANFAHR